MIHYYVVDGEMTGLKPGYHELNQLSIIRIADNFQRTFNIAISYPERVSEDALRIQKRTKADLLKGKSLPNVVDEANAFFEEDGSTPDGRCIIGHNIAFDTNFLFATWKEVNKVFPASLWLCTKSYAKAYTKRFGEEEFKKMQGYDKAKYGLNDCLTGLGIAPKIGAHSATIDTQNNLTLFKYLQDKKVDHINVIKKVAHVQNVSSYEDD
jgi:DNA polymerase III alpha subunit (gram-positive type)